LIKVTFYSIQPIDWLLSLGASQSVDPGVEFESIIKSLDADEPGHAMWRDFAVEALVADATAVTSRIGTGEQTAFALGDRAASHYKHRQRTNQSDELPNMAEIAVDETSRVLSTFA
jgi:hypothetical protein